MFQVRVRPLPPARLAGSVKAARKAEVLSAARLGISINTVRRHIAAIYEKLHVNSRLDAVGKLGRL
jgi:DNA-binding CsgD family transcriptional regulator